MLNASSAFSCYAWTLFSFGSYACHHYLDGTIFDIRQETLMLLLLLLILLLLYALEILFTQFPLCPMLYLLRKNTLWIFSRVFTFWLAWIFCLTQCKWQFLIVIYCLIVASEQKKNNDLQWPKAMSYFNDTCFKYFRMNNLHQVVYIKISRFLTNTRKLNVTYQILYDLYSWLNHFPLNEWGLL